MDPVDRKTNWAGRMKLKRAIVLRIYEHFTCVAFDYYPSGSGAWNITRV